MRLHVVVVAAVVVVVVVGEILITAVVVVRNFRWIFANSFESARFLADPAESQRILLPYAAMCFHVRVFFFVVYFIRAFFLRI